jgi:hypothetical protein
MDRPGREEEERDRVDLTIALDSFDFSFFSSPIGCSERVYFSSQLLRIQPGLQGILQIQIWWRNEGKREVESGAFR